MDNFNPGLKKPKGRVLKQPITPLRGEDPGSQFGESDSPSCLPPIINKRTLRKRRVEENNTLREQPPADQTRTAFRPSVREILRDEEKKKERLATADTGSLKVTELRQTWFNAHDEIGVQCPMVWANRPQKGQTKGLLWAGRLADIWPRGDNKGLHAFLYWVVTYWDDIMQSSAFNWMSSPRSVPDIRFVYDHHERLFGVWKGRAVDEWRSGPNAREIENLLVVGRTKEAKILMQEKAGG